MAELIQGYIVSSSNSSSKQPSSITVKNSNGTILARVRSDECKLLSKVRLWANHPLRAELTAQLKSCNVQEEIIQEILKPKRKEN